MKKALIEHIEYLLCIKNGKVTALSGGDISKAYLLETETEQFFCKINHGANALKLFQAEKQGLDAIAQTKTIATPKTLFCEALEKGALLVMEYIAPKKPDSKDMVLFGHQLAALHGRITTESFGWEDPNFIGNLPQSNIKNTNWSYFYIFERLLPQLKRAVAKKYLSTKELPSQTHLLKKFDSLMPKVVPALLHGDLWGGNYLFAQNGTPYLIDPAVYYGHNEVDLAMTRLFGGFDSSFYNAYQEHFPETDGAADRQEFYQLYYLLVHLNLFGSSYRGAVISILKKYFL